MEYFLEIPEECQLLEFFGVDPIKDLDEEYFLFSIKDGHNVGLDFSFNIFLKSVEIDLHINEHKICTVYREGADRIFIGEINGENVLFVYFDIKLEGMNLELHLNPISFKWGSILK